MITSNFLSSNNLLSIFFFFLKTLALALAVMGVLKFLFSGGSWVNYFIIVAGLLVILALAKLMIKR